MKRRRDRLEGDILYINHGSEGKREYDLSRIAWLIFTGVVEENIKGLTDDEKQLYLEFEFIKKLIIANGTDVFFLSIWRQLGERDSFEYESDSWNNSILSRWTMFCFVMAVQKRVDRLEQTVGQYKLFQ